MIKKRKNTKLNYQIFRKGLSPTPPPKVSLTSSPVPFSQGRRGERKEDFKSLSLGRGI
jgi:hypothetical protein